MNRVTDGTSETEQASQERAWLVRLCARLTGAPDVAEDLAQETLLEAWRNAHKLYDPAGRERWLAAIARNVCRRWRRRYWKTSMRLTVVGLDEGLSDSFDMTLDPERRELVELINRALLLLHPSTREVLVQRYMHELPYRTIAERLGVSEDAVAMRLSRGKLLLRRVLTTELKEAVLAYESGSGTSDAWEATRLWCQICGQHRLLARLPHTSGTVAFRCPGCSPDPTAPSAAYSLMNGHFAHLLGGLRRPKVIQRHAATWAHTYFRAALADGSARCTNCQRLADLQVCPWDDPISHQSYPLFLYIVCEFCGAAVSTSFRGLTLTLPEVYAFWQSETRIRMLPDYELEVDGQAAVVSRFESLTSAAQLDLILMRNPFLLHDSYRAVEGTRSL